MPADSLYVNTKAVEKNTFDAIVIGSGISGGWAAKELCDRGIKTLVLERGRNVTHIKDYPTATKHPWEFRHRGAITAALQKENPIVSKCYAFDEGAQHFFVKDKEHPYIQEKPFDWIRGYQVGGKSLMWARETQRWSRFEFEAPARDGYAVDWPIRYNDLAPWYTHVERFVGISGNMDGIENLPDGEFLPPWEFNCVEKSMQQKVNAYYKDRRMLMGRCTNLTKAGELQLKQGRGPCQARNLCHRGCPYGGYFSSNSSTLPWAANTGNLTLRPESVVHSIIYDEQKGKAIGVRVIDAITKEATEYFAKIIFLNAACLNSNLVLLNSISNRFPNGLGNDNDLLGRYMTFQNYRGSLNADIDGFEDEYYYGRRPVSPLMPSFRNVHKKEMDFMGGYLVFWGAYRNTGNANNNENIGASFKDAMCEAGNWGVYMSMQGEVIPKFDNHVRLSKDLKDEWGIPQLITAVEYDDNDEKMLQDFLIQGAEILRIAGCKNIIPNDSKQTPGLDIHEMGGIRMGHDPKTSLLNKWNQLHACKNVFVTDGSCMTSSGNQNPSLTFMALTARAANYAADELKKGNL
ncbi:GMC family oxidoreductase [Panacibacter ginsenosidivorans]|uniref:GMC family oxidoreductase n=1 Tax=Panacibacter ginsenosidivorans TaxID=1813871 RepID=A0A5B8VCT8_9BACT|nr:GMC family oxidoreductase [Panacibacter ginsenosidivorans]QEC69122.1 GMC family oxidoreductase [Panacibacter ginsenosidivorans]